ASREPGAAPASPGLAGISDPQVRSLAEHPARGNQAAATGARLREGTGNGAARSALLYAISIGTVPRNARRRRRGLLRAAIAGGEEAVAFGCAPGNLSLRRNRFRAGG